MKKIIYIIIALIVIMLALRALSSEPKIATEPLNINNTNTTQASTKTNTTSTNTNMTTDNTEITATTATLKTNMGDIVIELDNKNTPITAANFATLATNGFYNGIKFHRVISGFMIQGGDPLTKDDSKQGYWGTGGPGYQFADEIKSTNSNIVGTIAMANSGPNTNGSQFFINTANNNFLDTKHTVFGKVIAGADVVKKIESSKTVGQDRPASPIIINSIELK